MTHSLLQNELHTWLHAGSIGYAIFDDEERLRDANDAFLVNLAAGLAEATTWESMMRNCHRSRRGLLIDTPDIDAWVGQVRRTFKSKPVRSFEADLVDGRWLWVTESLRPDGWLLVTTVDVTALKASQATLRRARDDAIVAATTDPLTELHNRRFMFGRLQELLAQGAEAERPVCVGLLDLDYFKRINDAHGHGAGDGVLKQFAVLFKQNLRPHDFTGRIGGEEFLVILPDTQARDACVVLDRLRGLVAISCPLPNSVPTLRYTVSIGMVQARAGDSPDIVVNRADEALYRAKALGRNRLVDAATVA
jgi:diguanylate cyclase